MKIKYFLNNPIEDGYFLINEIGIEYNQPFNSKIHTLFHELLHFAFSFFPKPLKTELNVLLDTLTDWFEDLQQNKYAVKEKIYKLSITKY